MLNEAVIRTRGKEAIAAMKSSVWVEPKREPNEQSPAAPSQIELLDERQSRLI